MEARRASYRLGPAGVRKPAEKETAGGSGRPGRKLPSYGDLSALRSETGAADVASWVVLRVGDEDEGGWSGAYSDDICAIESVTGQAAVVLG